MTLTGALVRERVNPTELREPRLERKIVRESAEERLTKVDVCLDKTRQDYETTAIDRRWL